MKSFGDIGQRFTKGILKGSMLEVAGANVELQLINMKMLFGGNAEAAK